VTAPGWAAQETGQKYRSPQLTFELLVQPSSGSYTQGADKLLELDCPALVLVENVEYVICELGWIAKGEELAIDLLEL
jgi:hypothetical protein